MNPPVTYAPQAIGIRLSMLFNSSPVVSLYFARLASLACWLLAVYWVIKRLPFGNWFVYVIALFPMDLSPAASASADATVNTLCLLAIGIILTMITTTSISLRKLVAGLVIVICLALTKIPYLLVLLLALAIPSQKFPLKFSKRFCIIVLLLSCLFLAAIWNGSVQSTHVDLRPNTSVIEQMKFIIDSPLVFLRALLIFPLSPQIGVTFTQVYGLLGWNEIGLPIWLIFGGYSLAALALCEPALKKSQA